MAKISHEKLTDFDQDKRQEFWRIEKIYFGISNSRFWNQNFYLKFGF